MHGEIGCMVITGGPWELDEYKKAFSQPQVRQRDHALVFIWPLGEVVKQHYFFNLWRTKMAH